MIQLSQIRKGSGKMEERIRKISANRASSGSADGNAMVYVLGLPSPWAKKLGITKENRSSFIYFDEINNQITIEKDPVPENKPEVAE